MQSDEVLTGQGYRLEMALEGRLLTVHLRGDAQETTLVRTYEYWARIAAAVRESGAGQLLVLDALPGEVMSDADLEQFFDRIAGLGFEDVQVAYVEGRVDQIARIEHVEQLALERGYRIRTFANEPNARLWLRYGEG